jgi:hypothetical protein
MVTEELPGDENSWESRHKNPSGLELDDERLAPQPVPEEAN